MDQKYIVKTEIDINAPTAKVWNALTNPHIIKQYMFGSEVISDWKKGSTILWKGVWKGKKYEDKGVILDIEYEQKLQYTHFSPLGGKPDVPENYNTVTFTLAKKDKCTELLLSQNNNASEEARDHSKQMWDTMLESLKKILEK